MSSFLGVTAVDEKIAFWQEKANETTSNLPVSFAHRKWGLFKSVASAASFCSILRMLLPEPLQQVDRTYVKWQGRKLSYFAGCDYFRMSSHPAVLKAMAEGLRKYGLNVSASRKTTGNHIVYQRLEAKLESFFGVEKAVLTSNGYLSNLVLMQGIATEADLVLLDEKAHGSLHDASVLSGLPVVRFASGNVVDFRRQIARAKKKRIIAATDGFFTHNGRIAPLDQYLNSLPVNSFLVVDDSHGGGVLGRQGRGTPEYCGISDPRLIQTITLSKAFGVYGGAVLTSQEIANLIITHSRIFVGNTPIPLPLAHAAAKAVLLVKQVAHRQKLRRNLAFLKNTYLAQADWTGITPVFGVAPLTAAGSNDLHKSLLSHRVFPSFIRYPGGGEEGYFRFAISSEHSREQIDRLGTTLVDAGIIQTL